MKIQDQPSVSAATSLPAQLPSRVPDALSGARVRLAAELDSLVDGAVVEELAGELKGAGERFLDGALGAVRPSAGSSSLLDQLRGAATDPSRNPLDQQGTGFVGSSLGRLSEDGEEEGGIIAAVKNFFSSVFGTAAGNPAARTPVGNGAGAAAGAAFGILTANTGSVEDKKNEANGIFGIFRQGKTGTSSAEANEQMKMVDLDGTPNPEAPDTGGPHFVTGADLRGIAARLGGAAEYTGDSNGSGGPVTTDASSPNGTVGLWSPDIDVARAVYTKFDAKGMEARINGKKLG